MSLPEQFPQRPIPPLHHVWVAGPGDGRRIFRTALMRSAGLARLGVLWVISMALLIISAQGNTDQIIAWLVVAVLLPVLFVILLLRRSKAQEAIMAPGSVWATGFGANELLIVTPISTLIVDYAALRPPQVVGPAVLLRTRYGASPASLPLELFPPEALTFLNQRTAR
ncbi:hypothetical protein GCM10009641_09390 [Mycobacterium cookii]|uniref:Uncharacterized protein n=1 Tax=Mycobacterium cookii TaxID=1775 RepID=A0A7I7L1W0_9MYCO|nr:hypothetical protein [Mycobacterium cookii]MCV7329873.1 hypothetical protein [Mycobacterium cookii]BBX48017.1 hypothetical protein MCOO_40320 [Mycobacterium cookii]